jgi:hypothetical protein
VVQLSATSSGAAASDADVARRFVRVFLQLTAGTATTDSATRSSEYSHARQTHRELDRDPNATTTSPSCGGDATSRDSDASRTGKLLLSRISASCWGTLTPPTVFPFLFFFFILSLFSIYVRCPSYRGLSLPLLFLIAHRFCDIV